MPSLIELYQQQLNLFLVDKGLAPNTMLVKRNKNKKFGDFYIAPIPKKYGFDPIEFSKEILKHFDNWHENLK